MSNLELETLLEEVQDGGVPVAQAGDRLARIPNEKVGDLATLDHDRERRTGIPEVVYGASKTAEEIAVILERLERARETARWRPLCLPKNGR